MKPRELGIVQLIGALIAGWFGWQYKRWDSVAIAVVFLITAYHHFTEKKH